MAAGPLYMQVEADLEQITNNRNNEILLQTSISVVSICHSVVSNPLFAIEILTSSSDLSYWSDCGVT